MAKKLKVPPKKVVKTVKSRLEKIASSKADESKSGTQALSPNRPLKKTSPKTEKKIGVKLKILETPVKARKTSPPKTARRRPHATRPTPDEEIQILERQNLVMDLKIAGTSFRKIHKRLNDLDYDVSLGTVHADYVASLERMQECNITKTELLVEQELAKIEDWEFELTMASKGKPLTPFERAAVNQSFIALQNQRDKFIGISKSKKSEINANDALAKLLGISPEALPSDGEDKQ